MSNKIALHCTQFIYLLFHTIAFLFFFYHSAFFIGELEITGDLSLIEAIAVLFETVVYIFVDCYIVKSFFDKSLKKLPIYILLIVDSLLLLYFVTLGVLNTVFCISISLQGDTFMDALPFIVVNVFWELFIGCLFVGIRIRLLKRIRGTYFRQSCK